MSPFLSSTALAGLLLFTFHHALLAETPGAFPSDLFPGVAGKSESDIRLAGVAALNPGRLLREEPKAARTAVQESRKTLVAELPRGGTYLRLYSLDTNAVRERVGKSPLILDCRYLATDAGQVDACVVLGSVLTGGRAPKLKCRGDYPVAAIVDSQSRQAGATAARSPQASPVLVLVNGRTSGPLEAVLSAVQSGDGVMLVGSTTSGATGAYKPLTGHAGWWALCGEVCPESGVSIVGVGVMPKFPVKVPAEDEFLGWQLVERGAPLSAVLKHESLGKTETAVSASKDQSNGKPASDTPADPALQRAQDVLAALQVLGGVPLSDKH